MPKTEKICFNNFSRVAFSFKQTAVTILFSHLKSSIPVLVPYSSSLFIFPTFSVPPLLFSFYARILYLSIPPDDLVLLFQITLPPLLWFALKSSFGQNSLFEIYTIEHKSSFWKFTNTHKSTTFQFFLSISRQIFQNRPQNKNEANQCKVRLSPSKMNDNLHTANDTPKKPPKKPKPLKLPTPPPDPWNEASTCPKAPGKEENAEEKCKEKRSMSGVTENDREMFEYIESLHKSVYSRSTSTFAPAIITEEAFDHLEKLYKLMEQMLELREQNVKLHRRYFFLLVEQIRNCLNLEFGTWSI